MFSQECKETIKSYFSLMNQLEDSKKSGVNNYSLSKAVKSAKKNVDDMLLEHFMQDEAETAQGLGFTVDELRLLNKNHWEIQNLTKRIDDGVDYFARPEVEVENELFKCWQQLVIRRDELENEIEELRERYRGDAF